MSDQSGRSSGGGAGLETLVLRFGLFAAAIIGFSAASRQLAAGDVLGDPLSLGIALALWIGCFALLVFAALRRPPGWAAWLVPALFLLVFGSFAHTHAYERQLYGPSATDLLLFQDYAARVLLEGDNPYAADLRQAYELYKAPLTFTTPVLDGDYTYRCAYPSLTFLSFVPFLVAGLPTSWLFPTFFLLTMGVLLWAAPKPLRPLVLLPWFAEQRFMEHALGGVADIQWALMLVLVVATWDRRIQRGVWFGCACAFKQSPWLLAPFLLVRIWHETEGPPRRRIQEMVTFGALAAAVFLAVNGPFLLVDPAEWFAGVFEPLLTPMITLGHGLSSLTMAGWIVLPKGYYSAFWMIGLAVALFAYWRHFPRVVDLMWMAPGMALWLGNRSLTSYWYYFAIPMVLGVLRTWWRHHHSSQPPEPWRSWTPTVALLGSFVVFVAGSFLLHSRDEPSLGVSVAPRVYSGGGERIEYLFVTVRNRSDDVLEPRFSVQSGANQPFFWTVVEGPPLLEADEEGDYEIRSSVWYEQFDVRRGALLTVADRDDFGHRASVWIEPTQGHADRGEVFNGRFRAWRADPLAPLSWGPEVQPADAGWVRAAVTSPRPDAMAFHLEEPVGERYHVARLDTRLALPDHSLTLGVHVPERANRLPELDLLYGVELVADRARILLLFGDEERLDWLDLNGEEVLYQMVPVPRSTWTEVRFHPRELFEATNQDILPVRHREHAFKGVDYPMTPVNLKLVLAARQQAGAVTAEFGALTDGSAKSDPELVFRRQREHPERWAMWIGDFNFEARNYARAARHYREVLRHAPRFGPALFQLAESDFELGRYDEALAGYQRAIDVGYEVGRAGTRRGWTLVETGDLDGALQAFEEAIPRLEASDAGPLAEAYKGIGIVHLARSDCQGAQAAFDAARRVRPPVELPVEAVGHCLAAVGE